jgi:hypothetical protein
MLGAELVGKPYSKAEHNASLRLLLDGRSKGSVEFKHQNISAVLIRMHLPYIHGYQPARNFQKTVLPEAIESYLLENPTFFDEIADGQILSPIRAPSTVDRPIEAYFESRPETIWGPPSDDKPWLSRRGKKIDFAQRDAANRTLGRLGEEFAMAIEKRRLRHCGRADLSEKVEWVAVTCGDGIGFDILSFDENNGTEQFIEVKTTGLGKHFPFYATATEVRCSEDRPEQFRLYRVFDFARRPSLFVIRGALSANCRLEAMSYQASF